MAGLSVDELQKKGMEIVSYVTNASINGIAMLSSANELANEYKSDNSYSNNSERIDSLIRWEATKNFTSGFVTGLGGFITLPVTIPGSMAASWILQARMSAAIAIICGHNVQEDRVKTLVMAAILGDSMANVFKEAGIQVAGKITKQLISQIPGKVFIEINKKVGFRLITKAGEKGVINCMKAIPLVGGPIGGGVDVASCYTVGKCAKKIFHDT